MKNVACCRGIISSLKIGIKGKAYLRNRSYKLQQANSRCLVKFTEPNLAVLAFEVMWKVQISANTAKH